MAAKYLREQFGELTARPDGFMRKFMELRTRQPGDHHKPTYKHAMGKACDRNRYIDILASDGARVPLVTPVDGSDYINASCVPVPDARRKYICSQGPLRHTCAHFWQMVYEQDTHCILFMGQCIERNIDKVFPYFPTGTTIDADNMPDTVEEGPGEQAVRFGRFEVVLKDVKCYHSYIRREIELRFHPEESSLEIPAIHTDRGFDSDSSSSSSSSVDPNRLLPGVAQSINLSPDLRSQHDLPPLPASSPSKRARLADVQTRHIYHYQFIEWKDFGAPRAAETMLEFLRDVRSTGRLDCVKYGPPVVHCSAGVGRTGTFILIDATLTMLSMRDNWTPQQVDINEQLLTYREYRFGLVQTPDQLAYAWNTVVHVLEDGEKEAPLWADVMRMNNVSPSLLENPKKLQREDANPEANINGSVADFVSILPSVTGSTQQLYAMRKVVQPKTVPAQKLAQPATAPIRSVIAQPSSPSTRRTTECPPSTVPEDDSHVVANASVRTRRSAEKGRMANRVRDIRSKMSTTDEHRARVDKLWPRLLLVGSAVTAAALAYVIYRYNGVH